MGIRGDERLIFKNKYLQTCFCQTSRLSHLGKLPDVVWPKIAQKRQKPEVVDFGATRSGFHKYHQILTIFGVFEQFFAKPHLVARQNRTIWRFGKNMSIKNPRVTQ